MKELQLDDKLNFVEEPVEVMDREIKQLKRSRIPIIKVRWNSKRGPEFTWEREDEIRAKYPHLFSIITSSSIKSRDEISGNMWGSEDLIENPINWDKPPKNRDEAWHAKIRLIDPDGEEFTKTFQSIPTSRKLSKKENPRKIIDLDHFHDT
ncbi:hypothetical protein Tco_1294564 [Tanacetum coccineum]